MIKIYSTPTCVPCKQLKAFLSEKKIPFDILDCEDIKNIAELEALSGGRAVPVIIVDGEVCPPGFNPNYLTAVLMQHGYIKNKAVDNSNENTEKPL